MYRYTVGLILAVSSNLAGADPALLYSTYLNGSEGVVLRASFVDRMGNAYLTAQPGPLISH